MKKNADRKVSVLFVKLHRLMSWNRTFSTTKQPFGTQVLIQFRPVDTITSTIVLNTQMFASPAPFCFIR